MTFEEYNTKAIALDARLDAVGFNKEWAFILGMMLGRMAAKMGGWDYVDAFLAEFVSVVREGQKSITITVEGKK